MAEINKEMKSMALFAVVAVALAITTVIGIVLLDKMKTTSMGNLSNTSGVNTSLDNFITGLTVFGSFMGIISLALVGKIIMGLFSSGKAA